MSLPQPPSGTGGPWSNDPPAAPDTPSAAAPASSSATPGSFPTCYRHPDREAGRSCTRCGRPACSACLVQATVGSHCVDCAKAARPSATVRAKDWRARQSTPATMVLIAINVAVFVWMVIADHGALGGDATRLHYELGLNRYALKVDPQWYRLITNGFIHFGIFHIALNMFSLYALGQIVERAIGPARFVLLYVASLLGGSLGVLIAPGQAALALTGGASGAIFGLLGATAIALHRRGVNVMNTSIGSVLLLNLLLTFTISGISIGGHLGGLVAGAVCGWFMLAPPWRQTGTWIAYAAAGAVCAVAVVACVVIVRNTTIPPAAVPVVRAYFGLDP